VTKELDGPFLTILYKFLIRAITDSEYQLIIYIKINETINKKETERVISVTVFND
jgi:hypothetical protein